MAKTEEERLAAKRLQWKTWRENNPERAYRGKIESQMRIRYGIKTIEERDAILASQGNACAICRRTDCVWGKGFNNTWHIDHDPNKPGTYRGILCAFCNTALGRLEKFLPAVTEYLRRGTGAASLPRNMDALSDKSYVEILPQDSPVDFGNSTCPQSDGCGF
jgi:hypothetical protein